MNLKRLTRRTFLRNAAGVTVGTWFSFGWLGEKGSRFSGSTAFAAEMKSLSSAEAEALLKMTRTLYPHDRLDDSIYQAVVDGIDGEMAGSSSVAQQIKEGLAKLDSEAGGDFAGKDEGARTQAVKALEGTPFFDTVKGKTSGIYNNPEAWKVLGYEGSSWEKGGYLTRGFNDLDWL
jgi:hypothetical protein